MRSGAPFIADTSAAGVRPAPVGFASLDGALADLPEIDAILADVAAARKVASDRPGPDVG
jgi:hypothetical protein